MVTVVELADEFLEEVEYDVAFLLRLSPLGEFPLDGGRKAEEI